MRNLARETYESIVHLFYPSTCFGCQSEIVEGDEMLCISCLQSLPYTSFETTENNPVSTLFWGRCKIINAFSTFYFIEQTPLQKIIHQIKYKNEENLGIYMGQLMGYKIEAIRRNITVDLCIPMPLHSTKERDRGYNQSALLTKGIEQVTGIPTKLNTLIRKTHTSSQTKKNRIERWVNVENIFDVKEPTAIKGKHILLVDDVITTGASIEACVNVLLANQAAGVSVASLAYTL